MMSAMIRKIAVEDNHAMSDIIRTVMPAFGAGGKGFAIHDAEVDNLHAAYTRIRSAYFVCEIGGKILGGGGVAQLDGADKNICELKKMYFLPDGRGKGLGQRVLTACLTAAAEAGFEFCYIETFNTMKAAMKLYEKNAFEKITGSLGNTGHFACDTFYLRKLS
jgi:putative acetyltransferase